MDYDTIVYKISNNLEKLKNAKDDNDKKRYEKKKNNYILLKSALDDAKSARDDAKSARDDAKSAQNQLSLLKSIVVSLKDFKEKGVPNLSEGKAADPSSSSNHEKCAKVKVSEFKNLYNPYCSNLDNKNSALWGVFKGDVQNNEITCESDVMFYFKLLMIDILALCGLEERLKTKSEFSITSFKADILIITHHGIPKGVIELKRPCKKFSNQSYGQIFDYMLLLQHMHGVSNLFGIISCYYKTRIVWLEGNTLASVDKPEQFSEEKIIKLNSPLHQIQVPEKLQCDSKQLVSLQNAHIKEVERTLYISQEINHTDFVDKESLLVKSLCSVVKKMLHSHIDQTLQFNHTFMKFDQNSFKWITLDKISFSDECRDKDSNSIPINYNIEDINNQEDYQVVYLISDLGSGVEGKAWLAINNKAKAFVIKFFKDKNQNGAITEQDNWSKIWGIKTLVSKFNNENCLLMPFFKPITYKDYEKDDFHDKLSKACDQFSKSNYEHSDLSLRHVGKYKDQGEEKLIFFDLGMVKQIEDKEKASKTMYNNVMESIKRNEKRREEKEKEEKEKEEKTNSSLYNIFKTPMKAQTSLSTQISTQKEEDEDDDEEEEEKVAELPPPKRPRGRPKKVTTTTTEPTIVNKKRTTSTRLSATDDDNNEDKDENEKSNKSKKDK